MASSSADCVFGGVRLISSASTMLPKIGPGTKVQRRCPVVGSSSMMSVPVMSEGIRSGVNWMRLKHQAERLGNRADHERLRRAGQAGDQAMAADKQRDQNLVEHFLLSDDHLADLGENVVPHRLKAFDALLQFHGIRIELCNGGHVFISLRWNPSVAVIIFERADSRARLQVMRGCDPPPCPSAPRRNRRGPG